MKVLVTGSAGMLGSAVIDTLRADRCEIVATGRSVRGEAVLPMDVQDWGSVRATFGEHKPDLVLHLAAETDVDICEQQPDHAYACNAFGTENIVRACGEQGAVMAYVSTANVFDGEKREPYTEYDTPNSVNVYGRSKHAGECIVERSLDRYFIFRAGWMVGGWEIDKKFVYTMIRLCREREELRVVDDKFGSPTFTADFATHMMAIVDSGRYGLYHLANNGTASRWEIAREIVKGLGKAGEVDVVPISSAEFPLPAPRPRSEMMQNLKLQLLGLDEMPHWKDALRDYLDENRDRA
ncbi:MAG: dTDP-4-dehydrorhamnose reductase [Planctomycetaceae bacterium]|nr:dTDP-4-dehydrorhamnose reductase [Planctomycetaceae bacterium]